MTTTFIAHNGEVILLGPQLRAGMRAGDQWVRRQGGAWKLQRRSDLPYPWWKMTTGDWDALVEEVGR